MRQYRYSYHTIVSYGSMVTQHHFQIRSTPHNDSHQRVVTHFVDHLSECRVVAGEDCFRNPIMYGSMILPHDIFVSTSQGVVECDIYRVVEPTPHPIFLMESKMTRLEGSLLRFAEKWEAEEEGGAMARSLAISDALHKVIEYRQWVTDTETAAAAAFEMAAGVCQDFAHILIAICRNSGIFARYCVGYLVGEGETHAWVEVYGEDGAWYGIDPTHNRQIEYDYIKIAHGRDAADCSVIRGVYSGSATQSTQVRVCVDRLK